MSLVSLQSFVLDALAMRPESQQLVERGERRRPKIWFPSGLGPWTLC